MMTIAEFWLDYKTCGDGESEEDIFYAGAATALAIVSAHLTVEQKAAYAAVPSIAQLLADVENFHTKENKNEN